MLNEQSHASYAQEDEEVQGKETRSIYRSKLRNVIPYLDSHFPDAIIEINKFNQSYSKYINCFLGQETKDAKNQPRNLPIWNY